MYSKILLFFSIYLAIILTIIQAKNDTNTTTDPHHTFLGGWHPLNVSDEGFNITLHKIEPQINGRMNQTHLYRIVGAIKAQYAVAGGIDYKATIAIGETNCNKSEIKNIKNCKIITGRSYPECEVRMWTRPWNDFYELTNLHCDSNITDYNTGYNTGFISG